MFMYYTVCYFTGIFYAVVRQSSMLFIDNKYSVFSVYHKSAVKDVSHRLHVDNWHTIAERSFTTLLTLRGAMEDF